MYYLRRASDRGHANYGWLDTYHTFSFADYRDPEHMGFSVLRVINEDRIAGGEGFPTHGHRDMEIITYVTEGALAHKDSLGNGTTITPGEVQRMSAGTGIRHSEYNAMEKPTHLFQIWILPEKEGVKPGYGQKRFEIGDKNLTLLVSKDGEDGSITINQEASIYAGRWAAGKELKFKMDSSRKAWIQMVRGNLMVNDQELQTSDGIGIAEIQDINLKAKSECEFLLFDLP
jgi:quercetin 2,3-dioxygenase